MTEQTGFSLEDRVLCSDGACIGTVGSDGLCKVCGRPYEGDEELPESDSAGAFDDSAKSEPPSSVSSVFSPNSKESDPMDPAERECCRDDTCIGIIGTDGTCGTCGKSRQG